MHDSKHLTAVEGLLDDLNPEQMFTLIHECKRHREHAAAKNTQPEISLSISEQHWAALRATFERPVVDPEREAQGLDYLCLTARECLRNGDKEDAVFAAFRVVRWCWAHQPHLGPIEGE